MKTLKDERTLAEIMQDFDDVELEAVRIFGQHILDGKGHEEATEAANTYLRDHGKNYI